MHTTSRSGLQVIDGTDEEQSFPAVNAQQMGVLDSAAFYHSGTLVNRANVSAIDGTWYYATDTGVLYLYANGSWAAVEEVSTKGATTSTAAPISAGAVVNGLSVTATVPASGLVRVSAYSIVYKSTDPGGVQGTGGTINIALHAASSAVSSPIGTNGWSVTPVMDVTLFNGYASTIGAAVITGTGPAGNSQGQLGGGGNTQNLSNPYVSGLFCASTSGNGGPTLSSPQMRGAPVDVWLPAGFQTFQLVYTASSGTAGGVSYQSLVVEPVPFG